MIKVHHLSDSRSQRVLWLLEELGLDYEVVRYERNPGNRLAPPELLKIHPLGKSPVIEDGEITVRRDRRRRRISVGRLWTRPATPGGGHGRCAPIHLLASLRRRFGHAAAAAEAGLQHNASAPRPG